MDVCNPSLSSGHCRTTWPLLPRARRHCHLREHAPCLDCQPHVDVCPSRRNCSPRVCFVFGGLVKIRRGGIQDAFRSPSPPPGRHEQYISLCCLTCVGFLLTSTHGDGLISRGRKGPRGGGPRPFPETHYVFPKNELQFEYHTSVSSYFHVCLS